MDNGNGIHFSNLLSEFVYVRTYARWLDAQKRRETWPETVKRYVDYYVRSNPKLQNLTFDLAGQVEQAILNKEILPSMRSLWCAGPAMDRDNTCGYNCSFLPIDNLKAFAEALYILMCGTGVGFSVERTFVDCLPKVAALTEESTSYVVEDSTEGWADSLHYALVEGHRGRKVWFDYSKIRPKGARLRIKGGTASGPEPLERVHKFVAETLEAAAGRRLKPIEAHDIMCMIAEIVMVGGFRRASLISFSDPDDNEMRHAKDWRLGKVPSIRYMANNSACVLTVMLIAVPPVRRCRVLPCPLVAVSSRRSPAVAGVRSAHGSWSRVVPRPRRSPDRLVRRQRRAPRAHRPRPARAR
jgi:ribonucleoside-diphosphate reductase alpha chain